MLTGCTPKVTEALVTPAPTFMPTVAPTPIVPIVPTTISSYIPPTDQNWLSPGKVQIGNFHAGGTAEWPITIHNGNNKETKFTISYREPSYTAEGYIKPPSSVQDWIIISDPFPVLAPKETREILVTVAMPEKGVSPGARWEFWISAVEENTGSLVTLELCSRWLVNMRA